MDSGFFSRHILGYSQLASPLIQLAKKDTPFIWTQSCAEAFDELKRRLITPPVLAYLDWTKPFIVTTDASSTAVSYILSQIVDGIEKPITYGGRALNKHELNYSPIEAETTAVVSGVKHFDLNLRNQPFTVYTDHAALTWLFNIKMPTGKLAKWSMFLQSYRLKIESRVGKAIPHADALSRIPYQPNESHDLDYILDNIIDPFSSLNNNISTKSNENTERTYNVQIIKADIQKIHRYDDMNLPSTLTKDKLTL